MIFWQLHHCWSQFTKSASELVWLVDRTSWFFKHDSSLSFANRLYQKFCFIRLLFCKLCHFVEELSFLFSFDLWTLWWDILTELLNLQTPNQTPFLRFVSKDLLSWSLKPRWESSGLSFSSSPSPSSSTPPSSSTSSSSSTTTTG